jgi:ubiquinol-cytochrome c reductase cytochrome c subunit
MRAAILTAVAATVFFAASSGSGAVRAQEDPMGEARDLFVSNCASCHGMAGEGTDAGPSLQGVGEASADFQLRTGRMPLSNPDAPTLRKPPAFGEDEIALLVAYVGSLGVGPEIPRVDPESGELPQGSELFIANCAACHGATATGGAVGGNAFAPGLHESSPVTVAEAMITGPGEMPKFAFSEGERNSILRYIEYLRTTESPGGFDIGGIGPVSEGYIAWVLAMLILVITVVVIGTRRGEKGS